MSLAGQNTFSVLEDLGLSEIRVRDALPALRMLAICFGNLLNLVLGMG